MPMGQEDSIAEQSQRRSIASFLGMGDRKEKRRSSTTSETAPDASTYACTPRVAAAVLLSQLAAHSAAAAHKRALCQHSDQGSTQTLVVIRKTVC